MEWTVLWLRTPRAEWNETWMKGLENERTRTERFSWRPSFLNRMVQFQISWNMPSPTPSPTYGNTALHAVTQPYVKSPSPTFIHLIYLQSPSPNCSHPILPVVTQPYMQSLYPTCSHPALPAVTQPYLQSPSPICSHSALPSVTQPYLQSPQWKCIWTNTKSTVSGPPSKIEKKIKTYLLSFNPIWRRVCHIKTQHLVFSLKTENSPPPTPFIVSISLVTPTFLIRQLSDIETISAGAFS